MCVYYHESLNVQRRTDVESDDLKMLWLDVGGSSSCARIGCGYRPPQMPQNYWDTFVHLTWRELATGLIPLLF